MKTFSLVIWIRPTTNFKVYPEILVLKQKLLHKGI